MVYASAYARTLGLGHVVLALPLGCGESLSYAMVLTKSSTLLATNTVLRILGPAYTGGMYVNQSLYHRGLRRTTALSFGQVNCLCLFGTGS